MKAPSQNLQFLRHFYLGASPHRRESSKLAVFIVSFLDLFEVKNKQTNKQTKTKGMNTRTLFSFLPLLAYLSKGFMRELLCRDSFQNI